MRVHPVLAAACFAAVTISAQTRIPRGPDGRGNLPNWGVKPAASRVPAGAGSNGIIYHNGPVMLGTTHIYYIWYGNWSSDPAAASILNNFANNIGGSPYFNINTTYTDGSATAVSNSVTLAGSINDTSAATSLSDANIWSAVTRAFTNGLPVDPNGVYFLLTAPGVTATSGFLTQYCGWHTYNIYNGIIIKYSFVGNAKGPSIGACAAQTAQSPNADPAVDGMVSVLAHELEESVSDPQLNAWYDSSGEENADKCAWNFGTTYTTGNASRANMKLGAMDYLIQQNWLNANGGSCAQSFNPNTDDFTLTVTPSTQTVIQGNTTLDYTIKVNDTGKFNSAVTFAVTGLPAGASLQAAPAPNATQATFRVVAPLSVATGTYALTITGTSGSLTHTASATLVVAADFSLSVTPASQTVLQGNTSSDYTIKVNKIGSFNSTVSFQVAGLPTGVTLKPAPGVSATSSTFKLAVASTAAAGTYPFTIVGTSGALAHSASATLVIASDFTLSLSPSTLSVVQGNASANCTITVTKVGATAPVVNFQVTGLPAGATLKAAPSPSASTTTFSVNVPLTVAAGNYPLTVTGTSGTLAHSVVATLAVKSAALALTATPGAVTIAQGSSGKVTIALTSATGFASTVSLAASGLPTGASAVLTAQSLNGNGSTTLTINPAGNTPKGASVITVTGTSGPLTASVKLTLTVK